MADVTDASFETAVVERSKQVPVVVDLWAQWCGPCKQLGPILEKVIAETEGAVELAKVDIDANPGIAQAFKVQSIPAVYAMSGGQVVDGFMGALGEAQVREFVQKLLPDEQPSAVEGLIAAGDEASLREALAAEPDNASAVLALAELLITTDRAGEGLDLLERIGESAQSRRLAALARTGPAAADDIEAQLAGLLATVKADDDARRRFVDLLELLGADDPRTAHWRRKLSAELF